MSLPEIGTRFSQKLRILRERMTLTRNGASSAATDWIRSLDATQVSSPALRCAIQEANAAAASELLADHFRQRSAPQFFIAPGQLELSVSEYRTRFPERAAEVVREACLLRAHRLKIFAFDEIQCGPAIPWREDVIHGKKSGLEHWSRIAYLDFSRVGDSKIVWEPNRHQHLVTLALAFLLTQEESYAEECFAQLSDWDIENPSLRGINWASSLELAFRAWSWIWVMQLLSGSKALTGERLGRILSGLRAHAEFIHNNLSTYFSPNTHLLGEGFALFAIGLMIPELQSSSKYLATGRGILIDQIQKQVRADGAHAEQSNYYHRYATDFFLCAAILAERNNKPLPSTYLDRVQKMVEFMMHTAWPDGSHPNTGDADGGRLVPIGVRVPNDHRSVLSTAAVLFRRGDFRARSGRLREETFWQLGADAFAQFENIEALNPGETSRLFGESGCAVMRSDWEKSAKMLTLDGGPQGLDACGHGHADALSIVCAADGVKWLVDPGTHVYTSSRESRDRFRSTFSHNTVLVDGVGQAEPADVFKWQQICNASVAQWLSSPVMDLVCASHQGYRRLPQPVVHSRWVVFCKPDYWFLLDDFSGAGNHRLETFFHFHPEVELELEAGLCHARSSGVNFSLVTEPRLNLEVIRGQEGSPEGWYSEDYGNRVPAPTVVARVQTAIPARIPWLLLPGSAAGTRLKRERASETEWTVSGTGADDTFYFKAPNSAGSPSNLQTDAEFAWIRTDSIGLMTALALVGGTRLEKSEAIVLSASQPLNNFSLKRDSERAEIWMAGDAEIQMELPGVSEILVNGVARRVGRAGSRVTIREGN